MDRAPIYLSIYLSIYHLSIYLEGGACAYLSIHLSIYHLSIYLEGGACAAGQLALPENAIDRLEQRAEVEP